MQRLGVAANAKSNRAGPLKGKRHPTNHRVLACQGLLPAACAGIGYHLNWPQEPVKLESRQLKNAGQNLHCLARAIIVPQNHRQIFAASPLDSDYHNV
jgi:hypothetical protein